MKKQLISAILITGAALGLYSTFQPVEQKKEIGLQLYSIRNELKRDLSGSLDSVAAAGYTFVEAAGYQDGKFYGMPPVEFRRLLESKGLKLVSSHIGRDLPTAENYDKTMAWWDEAITAHQAAGVPYIVQPWMGKRGYESLEGLKEYCDYFNQVGKKCSDVGIRFGYHNHDKEFLTLGDEVIYDYMLANTNPEHVFFQLDVYWATVGGVKPHIYLNKYPGRFELWHVKDYKEVGASGKINFETIYNQASISGMRFAVIEQEAFTQDAFTGIRQSCEFIQEAPYIKKSYNKK